MEKTIALFMMSMLLLSFVVADHNIYHDSEEDTIEANADASVDVDSNTSEENTIDAEASGELESNTSGEITSTNDSGISVIVDGMENGSLVINGVQMTTDVNVTENLEVMLSGGETGRIAISPGTAFEITANEFDTEPCFANCEVELLETKHEGEVVAAYKVTTEKPYKFLGLFTRNAEVSAEIDAETGTVIDTNRPWWTILSMEVNQSAEANGTVEENAGFGY